MLQRLQYFPTCSNLLSKLLIYLENYELLFAQFVHMKLIMIKSCTVVRIGFQINRPIEQKKATRL